MAISDKHVFESVRDFVKKAKVTLSEYKTIPHTMTNERFDKVIVSIIHLNTAFKYLKQLEKIPTDVLSLLIETLMKCSLLLTIDATQQNIKVEEALMLLSELADFSYKSIKSSEDVMQERPVAKGIG